MSETQEPPKEADAETPATTEAPAEEPAKEGEMPALIDNIVTKDDEEEPAKDTPSDEETAEEKEPSAFSKFCACLIKFYWTNEFLILILLAILIAFAYPPLGAIYLAPKITATWIAVMFIFLLAGLGLKTEEFSKASQQCSFNMFVFAYNFGVDSAFVFGVSRLLTHYNIINKDLADGMVIAASLPLTINMCVVLTKASGGDEAAAIINTAMWNMVGVFLSPILILGYIGQTGTVNRWKVFYKLALRVVLPIVVGQLLKYYVPVVRDFVKTYKPYFKKAQMYSLVYIVYTIFCRTFINDETEVPVADIFIMIAFIAICLTVLMVGAWYLMALFFKKEVRLRVCGLYACTHKTAAMGIPLINAIYEGNPKIGLYTLPLLIWHPSQLVFGTFLSPKLLAWVESFEENDDLALEVETEPKKLEEDKAPDAEANKGEIAGTESNLEKGVDAPSDEFSAVSAEMDA
eukprot:CAMPEP_0116151550 /NCGR_PEP_ID=MMETSP0329-20121206/20159_1 /TAXON_ID=697910 /ORGANISM="Pseudo-nitzschia arenysensis, Strain B593" /LENGTH=460 /DNA_ID=CAMNT_0003648175 /DNA_START=58 /DNA_END=1440 /DNA_ORIENTATION=-